MNMLWFGGFSGPRPPASMPVDSRRVWSDVEGCWSVGSWPKHEVRTAAAAGRHVAVFGPCGVQQKELEGIAIRGVPDDAAWKWTGSYTVVEVTEHGTKIWTDLSGAWPIYTLQTDDGVMWASSSRALAPLTNQKIDWDRLAAWILAPGVSSLSAGRSAFADIDLVPAGHQLTLPAVGRRVLRGVWWAWPCSDDPAVRLRRELEAAVAVRVDPAATPSADLSGGYDSTSLALLAARRVQPDRQVVAVTIHPAGITSGGDVDYARAAARSPGVDHRLMPLDARHAPYAELDNVPPTDEPAPSTTGYARFAARLRWLHEDVGSDCHMTGDGGDSLLCTPPIFIADLIRTRALGRALVETLRWARLRRRAAWPLLLAAAKTARTSQHEALLQLAHLMSTASGTTDLIRQVDGDIGWFPSTHIPPWSTSHARERVAAMARSAADKPGWLVADDVTTRIVAHTMAEVGRTARADAQLAEWHGIPLHNPFTDSRVLDAYLSITLDDRPGPADYKPLLGRALADVLPKEIAGRTTKGDFNADHYHGLRLALPYLRELADGYLAKEGLIEPDRLRHTLTLAASGLRIGFSAFEPAISVEVWLRALDNVPPVRWMNARPLKRGAV